MRKISEILIQNERMLVWLVTTYPTGALNLKKNKKINSVSYVTTDVQKTHLQTERQHAIRITAIFALNFHLPQAVLVTLPSINNQGTAH
jgi:hypothetical protein